MGFVDEVREAIDNGRDETVAVLASHHVVPAEESGQQTADLGLGGGPAFELEKTDAESTHTLDRQTEKLVLDALGIDDLDACEDTASEIRGHANW
jgi:hypothetical protein